MRNQKLTTGLCLAGALGLAAPTISQEISQAEGACQLYGVNDGGLNDSQLFTVNPDTHFVEKLGSLKEGYDIEALAAHPTTGVLYAASGDDTDGDGQNGHLYTVNTETGELTDKGSTGFAEIEGLSFRPTTEDGKLYGFAKGDGLLEIDPDTAKSDLIVSTKIKVEDLTWNNDGTLLYAALDDKLWVYDPNSQKFSKTCNLPGHTEALEMLPDNHLLIGVHGNQNILDFQVMDLASCNFNLEASAKIATDYNDVEGIAWPKQACSTGGAQEEQAPARGSEWVLWDGRNVEGSFKLKKGEWDGERWECKISGDTIFIQEHGCESWKESSMDEIMCLRNDSYLGVTSLSKGGFGGVVDYWVVALRGFIDSNGEYGEKRRWKKEGGKWKLCCCV
jgi:hypothetical protein